MDNASNVEADKTATVKVDTTAPVTTDNADSNWHGTAVTVTLSPTDSNAGVASTTYSVDGGPAQSGTSVLIPAPANGSNDGTHTI